MFYLHKKTCERERHFVKVITIVEKENRKKLSSALSIS